jgi:hypothetical protein
MSSEVNANLRQQGSYGVQREYQIVNGRNIRIAIGNKARHKIFNVPMLALAEKSKTHLHIAWAWLWLAISGVIAIPLYLYLKALLELKTHVLDFVILAGLVMAALIGFSMLILNFSRKRIYFTAYSKVPLFDILIGKPDPQSYKEFLNSFETCMQTTRSEWQLRDEQQIAGEIRMLRRLANEGVITQKVYEEAKDKMFSMSNKSSKVAE